jgi:hypothetical protein
MPVPLEPGSHKSDRKLYCLPSNLSCFAQVPMWSPTTPIAGMFGRLGRFGARCHLFLAMASPE